MTDWIPAWTEASLRTSISTSSTPEIGAAFAMLRTVPNTRHPRLANFSAAARPIPDDTPVTTTTAEFDMVVSFDTVH
jgi:hypothetical protein